MAKGRKLTTSQSERFLGSYGYGNGHGYVNAGNESELGEEDVWSMVDELASSGDREDDEEQEDRIASNSSRSDWNPRAPVESGNNNIPIMRRRGGGEERHFGGLSLAFESSEKTASSPRILHQFHYGREGVGQSPRGGGTHHMATSAPVNVPDWSKIYRVDSVESLQDSDGGLEEQSEMVPPHEYLARSRRTGTTSVFEGVGRTLKGRDLRRVRDAVWSQTGFDG